MRIHFLLPGMHRVHRGAEAAFEAVATEIAKLGLDEVTVVGSGPPKDNRPYRFQSSGLIRARAVRALPENSAVSIGIHLRRGLLGPQLPAPLPSSRRRHYRTCSYPFLNWMLTRWPPLRRKPAHVFVTQNGDWPAYSDKLEYRLFHCDGLVCTNPEYYERNKARWPSALIPNGIDPQRFVPGPGARARFGLPEDAIIVLMVSALIESKRVLEGMRAVAKIPNAMLVVAGDGPLRDQFDALGKELMPGRFRRMTLPSDQMPDLYRSADVFLHPTLYESFGNVYVEAMAVGLPVVAHDYEVTRWIFGEHPGLVDATDESALTAALTRAIRDGRADAATDQPSQLIAFPGRTSRDNIASFLLPSNNATQTTEAPLSSSINGLRRSAKRAA